LSPEAILQDLALQAAGQAVMVRGRAVTSGELGAMAAAVQAVLPAARPGRAAGRDILVLGGSLDDPVTRALLSWGTVAGAALLLEPGAGNVLGSAVWARPTLFVGSAAEAAGLRIAAERQKSRLRRLLGFPPGLPFGRLRTLLVTGPDPLPAAEEAFWRDRGVMVRFLPQCGIAGI
jgi:hypothetical protein